jgi:putative heme-binding domain-containing protein
MADLGDQTLRDRLREEWGNVGQNSAELQDEIRKTSAAYNSAPLWAFSESAGKVHFTKLCASCHQTNDPKLEFAPKLEGTRSKGADYVIENIIDPNAVIGRDYQAFNVLTVDGQVVSGLKQSESNSSVSIRTTTETVVIPLDQVEEMKRSDNSFMPQGLLNSLNERERIELIKYIMTL